MRSASVLLAAGLAAAAPAASAQSLVSTGESVLEAALIAGRPDGHGGRVAGLSLDLAPGWKTYWRAPGEAGVPPSFDWTASRNLAAIEVLWPAPTVFESFGMRTVGYAEDVVLPLRLTPADPARPVALAGTLRIGVCREICVFEETEVAASFAPDETGGTERVEAALEARPLPAAEAGLAEVRCRLSGSGSARALGATLRFEKPLQAPIVLVEGPEGTWIEDTETALAAGTLTVSATLNLVESAWVGRDDIRMTVLDAGLAAVVEGCRRGG